MIDWLVSSNSIRNRKEGLMLASSLLNEGYLQPAGDTSKAAAEGLSDTPFLDLSDAYYYFVSAVLVFLCFWFADTLLRLEPCFLSPEGKVVRN